MQDGIILKSARMLLKMARETKAVVAVNLPPFTSNSEKVAKLRKATKKMAQFQRKLCRACRNRNSRIEFIS